MRDVRLSAEAADAANRIRAIDRELDAIERERIGSITRGMRAPTGADVVLRWTQDRMDERQRALLEERAALAATLERLVGD